MNVFVSAAYDDVRDAHGAVVRLIQANCRRDEIDLLMSWERWLTVREQFGVVPDKVSHMGDPSTLPSSVLRDMLGGSPGIYNARSVIPGGGEIRWAIAGHVATALSAPRRRNAPAGLRRRMLCSLLGISRPELERLEGILAGGRIVVGVLARELERQRTQSILSSEGILQTSPARESELL